MNQPYRNPVATKIAEKMYGYEMVGDFLYTSATGMGEVDGLSDGEIAELTSRLQPEQVEVSTADIVLLMHQRDRMRGS